MVHQAQQGTGLTATGTRPSRKPKRSCRSHRRHSPGHRAEKKTAGAGAGRAGTGRPDIPNCPIYAGMPCQPPSTAATMEEYGLPSACSLHQCACSVDETCDWSFLAAIRRWHLSASGCVVTNAIVDEAQSVQSGLHKCLTSASTRASAGQCQCQCRFGGTNRPEI